VLTEAVERENAVFEPVEKTSEASGRATRVAAVNDGPDSAYAFRYTNRRAVSSCWDLM
jgi:hypothetical protein